MKPVLVICLLSILSITACSSDSSSKTQYYVLNSPTDNMSQQNGKKRQSKELKNENKTQILVEIMELPDYLAQASLVLQLSKHQLHYSHFHLWAEPLSVGLAQALTYDLNKSEHDFNFIVKSQSSKNANANVIIKIASFQATHLSQVILTGSYTIKPEHKASQANPTHNIINFTFAVDLNDNGYLHAVEKMRDIVTLLAQDIYEKVIASTYTAT